MTIILSHIRTKSCRAIISLAIASCLMFTPAHAGNLIQKGMDFLSGSGSEDSQSAPGRDEIAKAFKEALRIGSEKVVAQLGQENGFYKDPAVHIPLPEQFKTVKSAMDKAGLSFLTEDLELKLNRAAEKAAPEAKQLFFQAISDMTFDDVMQIYNGPKDSATQYFKQEMSEPLAEEMQPIIKNSMAQVGAVQTYDKLMDKYKAMPFMPDVKANLTDHVTQEGMEGIFHYMAQKEAAIRENPAQQTTDLLKRVFSRQ
ncbi:MAG: DUF4197 domain-containing protein [Thermodesulfobacteriota bacterium]